MSGIGIEYLLGLFFAISSLSFTGGNFSADAVKLIAGVILIVIAVAGFSPIH